MLGCLVVAELHGIMLLKSLIGAGLYCKMVAGWAGWAGLHVNPIQSVLWNYAKECGVAIMARIGFRHPEAVKRQPKVQKWIVCNFFDFLLSIDTMNNSLWTIILAILTVKGSMQKMKNIKHKQAKFEILRKMIAIYIKSKLRTCKIQIQKQKVWFFAKKRKKNWIFEFFFLWCQYCQKIFFWFFKNFKKEFEK